MIVDFLRILFSKYKLRGKHVKLQRGAKVLGSKFEGYNAIGLNTFFVQSSIGYASYIGANCHFSKTKIGRYCSIGNNVEVIVGRHPTEEWVSTHPCFFSTKKQSGLSFSQKDQFQELVYSEPNIYVTIGSDVWIGSRVIILHGIKIGDGAIIASGAVVTKNVPPFAIVGGVPAKIIRFRFSEDDIMFLNRLRWWDKSIEWIQSHAHNFSSIQLLRQNISL